MAARFPTKLTGNVNGTAGNLATQLDSALVTLGWSIQQTSGNQRIYAPGAGGTGYRLFLNDNAVSGSREAVVRLCEAASTIATLVNRCPTLAQRPDTNSRIRKSDTSNTTSRPYTIVGDHRFFVLSIEHGTAGEREIYMFGDAEGGLPSDAYNALIIMRGDTDLPVAGQNIAPNLAPNNLQFSGNGTAGFFARNVGGTVISDYLGLVILGNPASTLLNYGIGLYPHPFTLKLHYAPIGLISSGSATATQSAAGAPRGLVPFVFDTFTSFGIGTLVDGDTWTDTAYDAGSEFMLLNYNSNLASGPGYMMVLQTDGTWDPVAMRQV